METNYQTIFLKKGVIKQYNPMPHLYFTTEYTSGRTCRSRSLPHLLSHHDSGLGSYSGGNEAHRQASSRLVAELRQLLTLKQHYYPEGGWGWCVVVVALIVQMLAHGLQGSSGILVHEMTRKFGPSIVQPAGKSQNLENS